VLKAVLQPVKSTGDTGHGSCYLLVYVWVKGHLPDKGSAAWNICFPAST